jgi:hypothetical protein
MEQRHKTPTNPHQGILKFKAFSFDPQLLAELTEKLRLAYGPRCTVSAIQRASEGDLMIFVQIFEEAQR